MVGFCIYFLVTTIFLAVLSLVLGSKYFSTKKDLMETLSNIEHDERDEMLRIGILKECDKRIVDHTFSSINAHEMDFHE